jgi:hypothetical protein
MSANTTVQATDEQVGIETFFEADEYTPFGLMKVVNNILAAAEIDKVLPGPMFYTYTMKGFIPTIDDNRGPGRKVSKEAAIEWTSKYLAKQVTKA